MRRGTMRRALIFAVAAALAALASGDESINFFSVAASSEEVALALCAWRSYYISLRPLAPNLRFFLLAGSSVDTGRTCVAASAALSRAKPHGWENQTDDWIRCRVVTAGRFGWHRGDDCAPGQVQGATVTIIRPTAFPRGVEHIAAVGAGAAEPFVTARANKKYANKEEISFDVMRSAPDHWLLPLGVSRAFSVDHDVWFDASGGAAALSLDAALRGVAATHDRVAVGVAWDRGCFPASVLGIDLPRYCASRRQRAVYDATAAHVDAGPLWPGLTVHQPLVVALANATAVVDVVRAAPRPQAAEACGDAGPIPAYAARRSFLRDGCNALAGVAHGDHVGAAFLAAVEATFGGACVCASRDAAAVRLTKKRGKSHRAFAHDATRHVKHDGKKRPAHGGEV
ncbi:hypothetical protein SO694_0019107 [Aureococcus anophagefferens]|uniref:Uncharacterized protein n=1 Tax=Aureococcus anophagefferens TaxID=44056 RepID=A0ABR1FP65_AURAN